MQINKSEHYKQDLLSILEYIAKDKVSAMINFRKELNKSLNLLKSFPYKCKPSLYYEAKEIRDMSFKGYSIIYKVDESEQQILLLEMFHKNLPKLQQH